MFHNHYFRFPKDPNVLQTAADLQYANSNYTAALGGYTEMVAVKTDFFQLPIGTEAYSNQSINNFLDQSLYHRRPRRLHRYGRR